MLRVEVGTAKGRKAIHMGLERQMFGKKIKRLAEPYRDNGTQSELWSLGPVSRPRVCAQSGPTVCDPMDCSQPGSSVHGILQAGILKWGAVSSPGDLPDGGIEPLPPALAGRFFTTEHLTRIPCWSLWWLTYLGNRPSFEILSGG